MKRLIFESGLMASIKINEIEGGEGQENSDMRYRWFEPFITKIPKVIYWIL